MKKFLFFFLLLLGTMVSQAHDFSAVAPTGQTLYYTISGTTARVTYPGSSEYSPHSGYTAPTGDLTIPETVTYFGTTYSVTLIGNSAFYGCDGLTSVTIPNSVTSIGESAFSNCSGLTSVVIPDSVTIIGSYAFEYCSSLTSVVIPNSVTSIGSCAFEYCSSLTSVVIPNSVTSIGSCAFELCSGLTSITIPNSVTRISGYAFYGCDGLASVTIGNSVTSIGSYAFYGCSNVDTLYYNARNLTANSNWYNSSTSYNSYGFRSMTNLKVLVIGDSVQTIPAGAFYKQSHLTSVTIPNSVTSIGNWALAYCSGLTSVTIGNSVTSIGGYAFYDCSGLTSVTIGNSVTSIGNYAFSGCGNVDTLYYNARNLTANSDWYNSSSSYNSNGFRPMTNLKVLMIGDSVQTIPAGAFYNQIHLTSVTIPNSVTSIGSYAFYNCNGLTSVTIGNSVTSIGNHAFFDCSGLTSVIIPNSMTSIEWYAFYGCSGLTSVSIGNSVNSIGSYAFYGCSNLTALFCNLTVAPILGYDVFMNTNLQSIHIPCSGYESYMSRWNAYSELIPMPDPSFNRVISASDTVRGSVSLLSLPCQDTTIMQAIANYGYHFTQWSDGDMNNPRTFVLIQDTAFTAEFGYNQYTINGLSGNSTLGTVTGGGEYLYLDTVVLTAVPIDHYHFVQWQDGNTENPRTVVVTGDADYTAIFEIDVYHIAVESSDLNMGYVSGGGDVTYGQPVTVEATAYSGYHFSCWSNGNRYNPYTFASIQDLTLQAIFISDEAPFYTITVAANNAAMGSATGSGTYDAGTVALISAVPSEGCVFLHWSDGSTEAERLVEINATATYTAFFAPEQCSVNTTTNIAAAGTVSGNGTYNMGDTVTLTATANDGYRFDHWSDGSTEEVRTVVIDENLSAEMQLGTGNTYGITFTAYFVDEHEGIDDAALDEVKVYVTEGAIIVAAAENEQVRIYDLSGRIVAEGRIEGTFRYEAPTSGVYFVRAGIRKAQKVVVVK